MNILIIGGSLFLGRAVAVDAIKKGHRVSVFNRGKTKENLPEVEWIKGDRNDDLATLAGRKWDAVVDTCAYFPKQVVALLEAIGPRIGHYTLISSVSAYRDMSKKRIAEGCALSVPPPGKEERITQETYGPLKAGCEAAALGCGGGCRVLLVRPGIIVGPGDPTGRFAYWVTRLARGGEVLAPGNPEAPIQLLDVRDLAAWIVDRLAQGTSGVFNTVGRSMNWAEMLGSASAAVESNARLLWIEDEFLAAQGASDWTSIPLYLPKSNLALAGMFSIDGSAAEKLGLAHRAFAETVKETALWLKEDVKAPKLGLAADRETALIAAWTLRRDS